MVEKESLRSLSTAIIKSVYLFAFLLASKKKCPAQFREICSSPAYPCAGLKIHGLIERLCLFLADVADSLLGFSAVFNCAFSGYTVQENCGV